MARPLTALVVTVIGTPAAPTAEVTAPVPTPVISIVSPTVNTLVLAVVVMVIGVVAVPTAEVMVPVPLMLGKAFERGLDVVGVVGAAGFARGVAEVGVAAVAGGAVVSDGRGGLAVVGQGKGGGAGRGVVQGDGLRQARSRVQGNLEDAPAVGAGGENVVCLIERQRFDLDVRQTGSQRLPGGAAVGGPEHAFIVAHIQVAAAGVEYQRPGGHIGQVVADVDPGLTGVGGLPDLAAAEGRHAPRRPCSCCADRPQSG